ncbi:unnamed protein product [Cylicocyclus nassatus]|uniref:Uncharacterized protein n=1 Tax=Cylicocyclus nassatus TaxID=53992 RepID=A0AA36GS56_CYLNA|nr:unnamed protein product [Cylicocyclus nassatus]
MRKPGNDISKLGVKGKNNLDVSNCIPSTTTTQTWTTATPRRTSPPSMTTESETSTPDCLVWDWYRGYVPCSWMTTESASTDASTDSTTSQYSTVSTDCWEYDWTRGYNVPCSYTGQPKLQAESEPKQQAAHSGSLLETPTLNQCSCTDKNIWLDVYFLMDSSQAMTRNGFDEATSFAQSVLYKLNIGQGNGQQTRAGFISYSANANKNYDLTAFQSSDDMINKFNINYDGNRGTNIEAAIKLAAESFETSSHRSNVQKVIVIVASAYESGKYNDPTEIAKTFIEDGGFIITVEYLQEHGNPVPLLDKLSSGPEYSFTNRYGNLTAEQLRQAFCRINCFCPTNYLPYTQGDVVPVGGCYRPVPISAIQALAAKNCRQHHNAILAKVESRDKSTFLSTMFPSKTKFWIGLKNVDGYYQWADGTCLQNSDFQMWAPGYPNINAGDCVYTYQYSGFSSGWFNDDCSDDQNYVCQSVPCSADNYCATRD